MKFGVREICDVVLKAKANQKVGNKIFYKNEPVIYFDTLKTSSMEGAATTVYAQGGRGNARLMAWEGERTVTFTMEDALISPAGFMILSGAGLIEADSKQTIKVHTTEQTDKVKVTERDADGVPTEVTITLSNNPYIGDEVDETGKRIADGEDYIYVMLLDERGEVSSEPFIPDHNEIEPGVDEKGVSVYTIKLKARKYEDAGRALAAQTNPALLDSVSRGNQLNEFSNKSIVLVDYYVERAGGVSEITITPDKFGGYYYLEASTLFRNTDGVDMPAEFVIPNCKIQSNFSFTMASSGDPSTFTFTIDAFPDYTRFDRTKKVLAAIQIVTNADSAEELVRVATYSQDYADDNGMIDGPRPFESFTVLDENA